MSDIAQALHRHLPTHAALTSIGSRCYPLQLPQTATLPAVTYQRVSAEPIKHRGSCKASFNRPRFQLDGWADSYGDAEALRAALKDAMADLAQQSSPRIDVALLQDERDIYEAEPDRWRCSLDFFIWHTEA